MSEIPTDVIRVAKDDPRPNSVTATVSVDGVDVTITATGWTKAIQAIKALYLVGQEHILDELCASIEDAVDESVTE